MTRRRRTRTPARSRAGTAAAMLAAFLAGAASCAAAPPPPPLPAGCRSFEVFTALDGLPDDAVRAIRVAGERIWVGTDQGLALREADGTWRSWTTSEGLPWPVIQAIDVDPRTGDVWLGTWGGGLVRLSGGRFDRFDERNSGLAGDLVLAVRAEGGRILAATNAGVSLYDPARDAWDLALERRAGTPEIAVTSLARDPRGGLVAASCWDRVLRLDAGSERPGGIDSPAPPHPPPHTDTPLPGTPASPIALDAAGGALFALTPEALHRRVGPGAWERLDPRGPGLPPRATLECLAARSRSEIWIGTDAGLVALLDADTGRRVVYRKGRCGLPDDRIRCIAFAGREVWVGTARGLARGHDRGPLEPLPPEGNAGSAGPAVPPPTPPPSNPAGRSAPLTIAVLGPVTRTIALPGPPGPLPAPAPTPPPERADLLAVQRAVASEAARAQAQGLPRVGLVTGETAFARYVWITPEDEITHVVVRRGALGIVGSLGPGSRIASAAVRLGRVPLVNAASTTPGPSEAANPWIFRCPAHDPRYHARLLDRLLDRRGLERIALVRTRDPASRLHLEWWGRHARERGRPPAIDLTVDPARGDLSPVVEALRRRRVQAVVTWAGAPATARLLRGMRAAGLDVPFVGSDRIVTPAFARLAGPNPGLVLAPPPCPHRTAGDEPDGLGARLSHDATLHLLLAIRSAAGADRASVRRALEALRGSDRFLRLEGGRWVR